MALVPQRETGMTPYEIMLSESQERMLLVVKRGREAEVERIFDKWDLHASRIGHVTGDGMLRVKDRGTVVAEIPNGALTDEAPLYHRPMATPEYLADVRTLDLDGLPAAAPDAGASAGAVLLTLLGSPGSAANGGCTVRTTHGAHQHGQPARHGRRRRANQGNGPRAGDVGRRQRAYCYLDPRHGAMLAVAEAARNVACAGGKPIAATNCLNFGNPERPGIMWQLAQAIEGIGEACRALDTPITGGNVSLYNETDGRAIYPTPVIGVVGVLEHADRVVTRRFQAAGDVIVLLGEGRGELGGSEYLKTVHGVVRGVPPALDLAAERALQAVLVDLAAERLMRSAHDCSDGGLAVTLAECCFDTDGIGADVSIDGVAVAHSESVNRAAALFGESASRVVVSASPDAVAEVVRRASAAGVPSRIIGRTGGRSLRIAVGGEVAVDVAVVDAERAWADAVQRYFAKRVA